LLSSRPFKKNLTATPAGLLADPSPPEFCRLGNRPRAELLRKVFSLRALPIRGKCCAAVRQRMRHLLTGPVAYILPLPRVPWDCSNSQP